MNSDYLWFWDPVSGHSSPENQESKSVGGCGLLSSKHNMAVMSISNLVDTMFSDTIYKSWDN